MVNPKNMLLLTVLDLSFEPNQRITMIAKTVGLQGIGSTTVIYKKTERERGFKPAVRSMLSFTLKKRDFLGLKMLELNPFWNIPLGARAPYITFLVDWFDTLCFIIAGLRLTGFGRRKYDICLVQGPIEAVTGILLHKLGIVKLLVYDDFDYIPGWYTRKFRSMLMSCVEKMAIKKADLVTCSGSLLAMLRRMQTGKSIYHVPNGVNLDLFGPTGNRLDHSTRVLSLVYAGNISFRYSGLDMIFTALDLLVSDSDFEIKLYIIGHGIPGDVERLNEMVKRSTETGAKVEFHGLVPHDDVPSFYEKADVGLAVFPPIRLRKFAFPYKVVEYMAAGLAVVGTSGTETSRILRKYGSGMTTQYRPEALSEKLKILASNRKKLKIMQKAAVFASKEYDWKKLMTMELDLINGEWFSSCRET